MPAGAGVSLKSPGERLPRSGGKQSVRVAREHGVCPDPEPWSRSASGVAGSRERSGLGGRGSGARGESSGHGESRAEAETLPGAPDRGAEGTEQRGGPHPRARPRPPSDQSETRGGPTVSRPPPLNRPGKGRVLKEPRLAEGWTVGIWENPSLCPKRRHSEREGGVLRKKWKEGSVEKGLQCAVSHSLHSNDTPTLTGARIIRTQPSHLNPGLRDCDVIWKRIQ